MTIAELKKELDKFPDDTFVYVDWDPEGGNEYQPRGVEVFDPAWVNWTGEPSVKIC